MSNSKPKKPLEIRDKTIFDGIIVKFFFKYLYLLTFKLGGWKKIENPPEGAGITIAAPHTSNWDFFWALGAAILLNVKIYFSIKDSWCRIPVIGRFMLWMGAIPIDRSPGARGQVELISEFVDKHRDERIFFLFTPEGTRGGVKKWKTGFYHVAKDTNLPIFLAKVDYRTKESGVFHALPTSDNKDADIANIQESYKSVCGRFPDEQYPVYKGPLPEISAREARIMQALFSLKGMATQAEISAKMKFEELSSEVLDFLVEKGILERVDNQGAEQQYRLTVVGNGCWFHLAHGM